MNTQPILIGVDQGMGAIKLFGAQGGLQVESQVSVDGSQRVARMMGLRSRKPPLQVSTSAGSFYVGPGAHDWGRPVENLDYERLTGAPEMIAMFYGCLARYAQCYGPLDAPLAITVGLPLEPMSGDPAGVSANVEAVRRWMKGSHHWQADGISCQVEVADVKVTSQPVGALFDYLLDDGGALVPARKANLKKEIGIISVGFNTVELLCVRDKSPVQKFTAGATSGVRRLLDIVNAQRLYSLGELDAQLRAGQLDVSEALPVWAREVTGFVERQWGNAWRRFAVVLVVGGGAILLKDVLPQRFNGRAVVPDDPVLSIARGLYKLSLSQSRPRRKTGHAASEGSEA
ncbi:MAG: ParM/StbA family protein [Thermoflexales bacterium]|nr:ParM/StbA family protein [Thermoflexales bacterium]